MVKNTMRAIQQYIKVADQRYDLGAKNIDDIYYGHTNPFERIVAGFEFGFVQGRKAALSEIRKGGVV